MLQIQLQTQTFNIRQSMEQPLLLVYLQFSPSNICLRQWVTNSGKRNMIHQLTQRHVDKGVLKERPRKLLSIFNLECRSMAQTNEFLTMALAILGMGDIIWREDWIDMDEIYQGDVIISTLHHTLGHLLRSYRWVKVVNAEFFSDSNFNSLFRFSRFAWTSQQGVAR